MGRDDEATEWFGSQPVIGEMPAAAIITKLRALGDTTSADRLAAGGARADTFADFDLLGALGLNRIVKTTHVCGFLAEDGDRPIVPVTQVKPDPRLQQKKLKITLDGLHIARYPGGGRHDVLFDFAIQLQMNDGRPIYHYSANFQASNGETVPVANFPIFYGVQPSTEGITLGFQTVNIASSYNQGLLDFLHTDAFKAGLEVAKGFVPVLAQISSMTVGLAAWLAQQSENAKVQEFRQGLDFRAGRFGGGLAAGSFIFVQLPIEAQNEWSWDDWTVNPTLVRLVRRDDGETLDFNHLIVGVHVMS